MARAEIQRTNPLWFIVRLGFGPVSWVVVFFAGMTRAECVWPRGVNAPRCGISVAITAEAGRCLGCLFAPCRPLGWREGVQGECVNALDFGLEGLIDEPMTLQQPLAVEGLGDNCYLEMAFGTFGYVVFVTLVLNLKVDRLQR